MIVGPLRAARPRSRHSDEDRILPLINVVFLLLIFFMLAGKLAPSDPFRIDPPRSVSETDGGREDPVVHVGADGRIAVNGAATDGPGLAAAVRARLAGVPGRKVRVKIDAAAPADGLVNILDRLREAGAEKVRLLTQAGERP